MSTCPYLVCLTKKDRHVKVSGSFDAGLMPSVLARGRGRMDDERERTSRALVHAHEQLHPHGDAGVPAQWQEADVTSYNRWAQQVLHSGGPVRVPVEHLGSRR